MNEMPDNHELARKLAVLEERMNTHQAAYETALERIERRMAERDAEFAKRETRLILAIGGMIAIAAAVLGVLIKF